MSLLRSCSGPPPLHRPSTSLAARTGLVPCASCEPRTSDISGSRVLKRQSPVSGGASPGTPPLIVYRTGFPADKFRTRVTSQGSPVLGSRLARAWLKAHDLPSGGRAAHSGGQPAQRLQLHTLRGKPRGRSGPPLGQPRDSTVLRPGSRITFASRASTSSLCWPRPVILLSPPVGDFFFFEKLPL